VYIDVHALSGQRNLRQLSPLLVQHGGCGLGLLLGLFGVLGHALHGLLFLVAGDEECGQKQRECKNPLDG